MDWQKHYNLLEKMYQSAPINQFFESEITIIKENATISLSFEEKYCHGMQAMHGGVYFKLLDDACYFAVNSIVTDVYVVTSQFNIQMLRPFKSGQLFASGKVRFSSRNLWMAEGVLTDQRGREIAVGSGNFMRSKFPIE